MTHILDGVTEDEWRERQRTAGADLAEHLEDQERAAVVELLHVIARDEEAVKPVNEAIKRNRERLRAFHDRHPEEVISDFERGYVAAFEQRSQGAFIDVIALAENSPEAAHTLVSLARAGLLSVRLTGLRPLAGKSEWADEAMRFLDPGATTSVLAVKRIDDGSR